MGRGEGKYLPGGEFSWEARSNKSREFVFGTKGIQRGQVDTSAEFKDSKVEAQQPQRGVGNLLEEMNVVGRGKVMSLQNGYGVRGKEERVAI